jgi:hypothetical protein
MPKEQPRRQSKARILFGFAEVEGDDPAVVESVRALAASVVRALQGPQAIRSVKALQGNSTEAQPKDSEKTLFDEQESEVVNQGQNGDSEDVLDVEPAVAPVAPKETRPQKKTADLRFRA